MRLPEVPWPSMLQAFPYTVLPFYVVDILVFQKADDRSNMEPVFASAIDVLWFLRLKWPPPPCCDPSPSRGSPGCHCTGQGFVFLCKF